LNFTDAVRLCMPALDAVYSPWLAQPDPAKMTCTKGCGACCHYGVISSSSIEAFGIVVSWIGSERPLSELADRCSAYVAGYKKVVERIGHLPFSLAARREFLKEQLPCPLFVRQDERPFGGSCGFYEFRPIICSQFHSTESPAKCAAIQPHGTDSERMNSGDGAAYHLQEFERQQFGKSALGHLPLLIAALCNSQGLDAFLRVEQCSSDSQEQGARDFFFYCELLESLGISVGERDFADLERAQAEMSANEG
jgi:hypothetical protein